MKKIVFSACVSLILTLQMFIPVSAASRYNHYSTSGLKVPTDYFDNRFSAICCPGATVYADADVFTDLIAKQLDDYSVSFNGYSCFGNSGRSETLTLGIVDFDTRSQDGGLESYIYRHIDYIKSIGGNMTGYNLITDYDAYERTYYTAAVNISWDVDGMHHYARFEPDIYIVAYYDLAFPTGSSVQNDIPYMNDHFGCAFEYQGG